MSEPSDDSCIEAANSYARAHKKRIAIERTSLEVFPPDEIPVSVFMAGSPGAGKTESSKILIQGLSSDDRSILRIDPDELRSLFPDYTGQNSSLFQSATSILAEKMHDVALEQSQSFVFDGTLTNLGKSRENIQRSLKHGRTPYIVYVYQDPLQAWKFVKARERSDGRNIPKEVFIEQYFKARENVNCLKQEFGKKLHVDLIVKNIDGTDFRYYENISKIDGHVPQRYTKEDLDQLISENL